MKGPGLTDGRYGHTSYYMAIPKIKATYSLDVETMRVLERVSVRWGVSKSEALRRAIHSSANQPAPEPDDARFSALDALQKATALDTAGARAWERRVTAERRATAVPARRK